MKVHIDLKNQLNFEASTRHFSNILIDEPQTFHGTDLGPSAVEYLLIGVGGCLASSLIYCLNKNKIEVEDLRMDVNGTLKHTPPKMHLRLIGIECEIFVSINEKFISGLDKCLNIFQEHCVISESIINGIPLKINIKKNKK